jgi:hypothetical protein
VVPDVSNVTTPVRIRLIRFDYLAVYPLEQLQRLELLEQVDSTLHVEPGTLNPFIRWNVLNGAERLNGLNILNDYYRLSPRV